MGARILVVDDEPSLHRLMSFALEAEGFEVLSATTGQAALRLIAKERPDLVVLDVRLPDISGLEVCQQLRTDPATTGLPVIMLSALVEVEDRVKGLEAGADDYINKPVASDELVAYVHATLKRIRLRREQTDRPSDTPKILVVDDEPGLLRVMEVNLQFGGFDIITAGTGLEALEKVEEEKPDLVVLDVMLPDMSGLDVCRHLRASSDTADLPVIMTSALVEMEDRVKGIQAGADEYAVKPIEAEELVTRVRYRLKRQRSYGDRREQPRDEDPKRAKILVVDDEPSLLQMIACGFELAGYEVLTAETGEEALALIDSQSPDLAVLDVMLPDIDGLEVCRRLRSVSSTAHLPVIMLSAKTQTADRIAGIRAGANDYLNKPTEVDELVERAGAILQRRDRAAAAQQQ